MSSTEPFGRGLHGTTALVTGGGRGIGRVIAAHLAALSVNVAVAARSTHELDDVVNALRGTGGRVVAAPGDLTREENVDAVVRHVEAELGPVDLLVNNAGACRAIGRAWEVPSDDWWADILVNLRIPYLTTRAVLPSMIDRRRGTIVNISSYAATRPDPYTSAYGAAKAALAHFTASLAEEVRAHRIAVFAVAPGTVRTRLTEGLRDSEQARALLPRFQELRDEDWLPADRAAELVARLATGSADALSGRFLHALDDLGDLIGRLEEIEQGDLYALRLRRS